MFAFKAQAEANQYIQNLPNIEINSQAIEFIQTPKRYKQFLLDKIKEAKSRIFIVALYFENDEAGNEILEALYQAKSLNPSLEIVICVDWHRAQRGRIGEGNHYCKTNADWYLEIKNKYPSLDIKVYGVAVNTREALGVLHFKGAVFDNTLLFTGASINNVYLYQTDKYRLDRYHAIYNSCLCDTIVNYINNALITSDITLRLDTCDKPKTQEIKKQIKIFRRKLSKTNFNVICHNSSNILVDLQVKLDTISNQQSVINAYPIVGLGPKNPFNKLIEALMCITQEKLMICTPYFNLPPILLKRIRKKLKEGVSVDLIVGDKTANDFYIPQSQPFKAIGALPYLYEQNLIKFMKKNQKFCDKGQLSIYLWKDGDNSYHLKGLWSDDEWMLITGNNLNPRAWRLDLENGILLNDRKNYLKQRKQDELNLIHEHTKKINHFSELESIDNYPLKVKKLIRRVKRLRLDKIINRIL